MSEAERRKRLNYKKNRKKLIFIQAVAMAVIAVLIAASVLAYVQLGRTYYIDYVEDGRVDYMVQYKPNSFHEDEWQQPGRQYVTELVNSVSAEFNYALAMNTKNVNYRYTYKIDAVVSVIDDHTGNVIFDDCRTELVKSTTKEQSSNNRLVINEDVSIDFPTYNAVAQKYIDKYGLSNVTNVLSVTMTVNVNGTSDEFAVDSENVYFASLSIPLTERTMHIESSESIPTESKVLAYKNAVNQDTFKTLSVILGMIELFAVLIFVTFVYATRNHDVNYSIKVQKLLSGYRSFIQEIVNGFDIRGYQVLLVRNFSDMLAIRDTIQSPVLMSENTDQTRTQFFIPTNTKILYLYEIKVENYDEIYGAHPEYVDDSVVPTERINEHLTADITAGVVTETADKVVGIVTEAADKVVGIVTDKLGTAISEVTPGIVETAVSEARAAVDKRISEIPASGTATVTETPDTDRAVDDVATKLLMRLSEINVGKRPDPVINLNFRPVIDTPKPVVNLSVNPVVEREVVREVIATAEVAPTVSEPEVEVEAEPEREVESEPEREPIVYEQIEIATGIPEGEPEVIAVTAVEDEPESEG